MKSIYHRFLGGKGAALTGPTRRVPDIATAWDKIRRAVSVQCRLHDLWHTAATKMAEVGVSGGTMLAMLGHMSRAMRERYSYVRLTAKREAVEALSTAAQPAPMSGLQPRTMVSAPGIEPGTY